MNIINSSFVVTQSAKEFSLAQRIAAIASIALLLLIALTSATKQTVSEPQLDAKLTAAAMELRVSDIQKFFPASFR